MEGTVEGAGRERGHPAGEVGRAAAFQRDLEVGQLRTIAQHHLAQRVGLAGGRVRQRHISLDQGGTRIGADPYDVARGD